MATGRALADLRCSGASRPRVGALERRGGPRSPAQQVFGVVSRPPSSSIIEIAHRHQLEIEKTASEGTIKQMPVREDITLPIEEQLIVELYSR